MNPQEWNDQAYAREQERQKNLTPAQRAVDLAEKQRRFISATSGVEKRAEFSRPAVVTVLYVIAMMSLLGGIASWFMDQPLQALYSLGAGVGIFAWGATIEYLARIAFHVERSADIASAARNEKS